MLIILNNKDLHNINWAVNVLIKKILSLDCLHFLSQDLLVLICPSLLFFTSLLLLSLIACNMTFANFCGKAKEVKDRSDK